MEDPSNTPDKDSAAAKPSSGHNGNSSVSEESSDDDDLVLEGELVRNADASSSSSDNNNNDDDDEKDPKPAVAAQRSGENKESKRKEATKGNPGVDPQQQQQQPKNPKKKKPNDDNDTTSNLEQVEFIFCDLEQPYRDGCKALLMNSSTVYQRHASIWTDWLLEQVIGTLISTAPAHASEDHVVFGFASLVQVRDLSSSNEEDKEGKEDKERKLDKEKEGTTDKGKAGEKPQDDDDQSVLYQRQQALNYLQQHCGLQQQDDSGEHGCPKEYQDDMRRLFDKAAQPLLHVFLHGRMINLPLEIVLALHQQLWLDWEFDTQQNNKNANRKGEEHANQKKSKKQKMKQQQQHVSASVPIVSATEPRILRLAPCTKGGADGMLIYRYYDDELLADRALVQYTVKAPKSYSQEEAQFLQVMVLTPQTYRQAIDDLEQLVG